MHSYNAADIKSSQQSLFNKVKMGYVIVESNRFEQWLPFGRDALGMHLEEHSENALAFRIDNHSRRMMIQRGPAEDIAVLGWQVDSEDTVKEIGQRLQNHALNLTKGSDSEADFRGVEAFWFCTGPKAQRLELFVTANTTESPLKMKTSGFITGDSGMGHVAITSRKPENMVAFWQTIFDAKHSDDIEEKISGVQLDVKFLRLNERHHSVAVAATRGLRMDPFRTRIQHMNLQAKELEDITQAYLQCKKLGFPIMMGVGQHTNDREVSFYVRTPSDFEIELGWNPITVDEALWQPQLHQGISTWGHKPEDQTARDKFTELRNSLCSLFNNEYSPI